MLKRKWKKSKTSNKNKIFANKNNHSASKKKIPSDIERILIVLVERNSDYDNKKKNKINEIKKRKVQHLKNDMEEKQEDQAVR